MLLIICFFGISLVQASISDVLLNQRRHEHFMTDSKCLVEICKKSLFTPQVVVVDSGARTNDIISSMQGSQIPYITMKINALYIAKEAIKDHILAVIQIDDCTDATSFKSDIIIEHWLHVIILTDFVKECEVNLQKFGEFVDRYDVTFIIERAADEDYNKIVTFFPEIDEKTCNLSKTITPNHINTCVSGKLKNNELFPLKRIKNYKKCPFHVGISPMYPFVFVPQKDRQRDMTPIAGAHGSDVEITKIVAQYLNTTIKMYYIFKDVKNPFIDFQFLLFIANGSLDACVGGYYRIYGSIVEYSGIYNRQAVIWIYAVERPARTWQNLIRKINGIYLFVVFYTCYSVVWFIISYFDGDKSNLANTFFFSLGSLLGCASLQEARSDKQKILNFCYLIMCLHLAAYVNIQLYSFLTIQSPPETFHTIYDIMNSDRRAYLNNRTKYFLDDTKYIDYAKKSAECSTFETCQETILTNNGVTLTLDGYFFAFQVKTAVNYEARVLKTSDNMMTVYHEMILRKSSLKNAVFVDVVSRLYEAGICDQLFKVAVGLTVEDKSSSVTNNALRNGYSCEEGCPITLSQVVGVFYLWAIGIALSCFVLIIELYSVEKTEMKVETFTFLH
ncbi:uncharacterized protein LOC119693512 [Plutella xylostella]|uniref:uncharacterized protein LOC119693512 n=1 Tax=Plutella xylostella TaxID=51655 RepID=UPI002032A84C|nr:uncharacterized protein LOC119693512 [Plutella xylostella]